MTWLWKAGSALGQAPLVLCTIATQSTILPAQRGDCLVPEIALVALGGFY